MGFYIGITGWLLDERRNASLVAAVRDVIPLERIMVETDAPWLSVTKGRRSEPKDVAVVLRRVAHLKRVDEATCAAATLANVRALFGIRVDE
jgi:TatD DNase family protein